MKFKIDENMPKDLVEYLRHEGHDAVDVLEEGLQGEKDASILKIATSENRILITFDLDFADIRQYTLGTHAGTVVFRLKDQRWQDLEGPLRRLLEIDDLAALERSLAIVDDQKIRIRRFRKK